MRTLNNPRNRGTSLTASLLIYIILLIAATTLIPFDFKVPERVEINLTGSVSDAIGNIVLFLPVGFLFQLVRRKAGIGSILQAMVFGVLLSSIVEAGQVLLPSRNPSLIDMATNGLGALMGAWTASCLTPREPNEPTTRFLTFELPLMNVVYMAIPLLWLGSLSLGGEADRLWLPALLGVFGGSVISAVYVNRMQTEQRSAVPMAGVYASGWFLIGSLPAIFEFPFEVITLVVMVGTAAQLAAWFWRRRGKSDRRFERQTLKKVFPFFCVYLLLLSFWPTTLPIAGWSNGLEYQRMTEVQRIVLTARFIEVIAAFTLLGYLVAGMRGRMSESGLKTAGWVFGVSLPFLILFAVLRDFASGPQSTGLTAAIFVTAALYGALIYRLQLSAVMSSKIGSKSD